MELPQMPKVPVLINQFLLNEPQRGRAGDLCVSLFHDSQELIRTGGKLLEWQPAELLAAP